MTELEKKPFVEHIRELRKRLVISILAFVTASVVSYIFVQDIYSFLVQPLADALGDESGRKMIYTGLAEAFLTYLKLAMFAGLIFSFPVIASQMYMFCAPGLYSHEKKLFIPLLVISPVLFLAGAALVYYLLFPMAWEFFLSFEVPSGEGSIPIQLEARVSEYLSLVTALILAFGITFQLPLVVILLVRIGIVTVEQLKAFRKYAVVLILTVAAILTPPDVLSQITLATPLYLLYEMAIILCARMKKHA